MYKQVDVTSEITMNNNSKMNPIATLKDESGGVCQIINDDHCYQICLNQEDGTYKPSTYIFKEVFEVLKKLDSPI